MLQLIMLRGLPGSGKSFWAAEEKARLEANHFECVIVNKDDIRAELVKTGWTWSRENEKDVIMSRDAQIIEALTAGKFVISSDCNFGKHKERLMQIAARHKAEFVVKDLTMVPVLTCVHRDEARPKEKQVGAAVIKEMYAKYLALPAVEPYVANPDLPKAIICDLDGTLAHHEGVRGIYDYANVGKDKLSLPIYQLVYSMHKAGYKIVYMSGRDEVCRQETSDWLNKHNLPAGPLMMRSKGDHRKDYIVKSQLFDVYVRNTYNVVFTVDDRDQVVKLWRNLGIVCLQCAYGDF